MSKLGDRLRDLMRDKGVSVAQLAEAGGIDESTMQSILGGDITRPPDRRLQGFADLLDVSLDSLLELIPQERREEARFDPMSSAAAINPGTAPEWIQLLPIGEVRLRDGRGPFRVRDAKSLINASKASGSLPIDYDHQTELTRESGNRAPAAGWMVELATREDGIWARVEWTERGAAAVAAKEYRFISPVFTFDEETKTVTRILRAGLVNNPALDLKALASREDDNRGVPMDELLKKLRQLLGLAEGADEKAVCSAVETVIAASKETGATDMAPVAKALGLDADASAADIEAAAAKATAGAAKADNDGETAKRLKALEEERATEKAEASADEAIKAGKLTPAQRDWAIGRAKADAEDFGKFLEGQPVILASGSGAPRRQPGKGSTELTPEELAVCKAMGHTKEAYLKARNGDEEEAA